LVVFLHRKVARTVVDEDADVGGKLVGDDDVALSVFVDVPVKRIFLTNG